MSERRRICRRRLSIRYSTPLSATVYLVEGVRCVRDELSEEDLLVAVERVDDQLHHSVHLERNR